MSYPEPRYHGSAGEISAILRPGSAEPDVRNMPGNDVRYLATGASTGGQFGLYRWDFGPKRSGPDPQSQAGRSPSLFARSGTVPLAQIKAILRAASRMSRPSRSAPTGRPPRPSTPPAGTAGYFVDACRGRACTPGGSRETDRAEPALPAAPRGGRRAECGRSGQSSSASSRKAGAAAGRGQAGAVLLIYHGQVTEDSDRPSRGPVRSGTRRSQRRAGRGLSRPRGQRARCPRMEAFVQLGTAHISVAQWQVVRSAR